MNLREKLPRWGPDAEVKAFVADLDGVAYSSYTNQRLWIRTGNVVLVAIIWALLTNHVARLDGLTGFLAVWCGYLLGKSGVTAASRYGKAKTEAKDRGEDAVKVDSANRRKSDRPNFGPKEPNIYQDDERGDA